MRLQLAGQQGQVSHFPKIVRLFHTPIHSRKVDFKGLSILRGIRG